MKKAEKIVSKGVVFSKKANMWVKFEHYNEKGKADLMEYFTK